MGQDDTRLPDMEATASGNARVYQAQTQHIHHHGDQTRGAAAAVVVSVAPLVDAGRSGFVGRAGLVEELLAQLHPESEAPVTAVVSAVSGMGGIGKTALAVHVAGLAVGRGWFPGGAVLVDLHGYDEGRVEPGQVFAPMLRALGVEGERVPVEAGEQAAVYHHLFATLAAAGRRVLVVLDNASTGGQVTDLLPHHLAHRVVVTTRDTLTLPTPARRIDLHVLPEAEAVDLLHRAVGEQCPSDTRVLDQVEQARGVVEWCGCLPLAVRIAGAILGSDRDLPVGDLAGELADTRTRLDTLTHGESGVAAAFDLSWRHLTDRDPNAARVFRLLPVNPGPEVSTDTAAALADLPVPVVRQLLRVLARPCHGFCVSHGWGVVVILVEG